MINTISETTWPSVAEVALTYPSAFAVFTKYNIDFCCGGKRSLKETCEKKGLNTETIWNEIVQGNTTGNSLARFSTWTNSLLVDFIEQNHHAYIRQATPQIQELLDKVCSVHGEDHIELSEIRDDFFDLTEELFTHMRKEESFLFPVIKEHSQPDDSNIQLEGPISVMEDEHEIAGDLTKSIRQLSKQYTPPQNACPTFRLLYKKLEEFDQDLMQHIHLENNILFDRVRKSN